MQLGQATLRPTRSGTTEQLAVQLGSRKGERRSCSAEAGFQMISVVAWKICPPCNSGGREVYRKTEKKLVTALRASVAFRFRVLPNLNGRLGLKNLLSNHKKRLQ